MSTTEGRDPVSTLDDLTSRRYPQPLPFFPRCEKFSIQSLSRVSTQKYLRRMMRCLLPLSAPPLRLGRRRSMAAPITHSPVVVSFYIKSSRLIRPYSRRWIESTWTCIETLNNMASLYIVMSPYATYALSHPMKTKIYHDTCFESMFVSLAMDQGGAG